MCIEEEKAEMSSGEPENKKEYHGSYLSHSVPLRAE